MIDSVGVQGVELTPEIEKVINNCYYVKENKPHDCFEHCPLCEICCKYFTGE